MGLGRVVKGSVHDCDKKWLERQLKAYDSQLYIKWNPDKNHGRGIWEIRRRPDRKSLVWQGSRWFKVEYVENDQIHHVMDSFVLTPRILDKIYEMDTTRHHNYVDKLEYEQERSQIRLENEARKEREYIVRHEMRYFKHLKEEMLAGRNPLRFFFGSY